MAAWVLAQHHEHDLVQPGWDSYQMHEPLMEEESGFVSRWVAVCNEITLADEAVMKMY